MWRARCALRLETERVTAARRSSSSPSPTTRRPFVVLAVVKGAREDLAAWRRLRASAVARRFESVFSDELGTVPRHLGPGNGRAHRVLHFRRSDAHDVRPHEQLGLHAGAGRLVRRRSVRRRVVAGARHRLARRRRRVVSGSEVAAAARRRQRRVVGSGASSAAAAGRRRRGTRTHTRTHSVGTRGGTTRHDRRDTRA